MSVLELRESPNLGVLFPKAVISGFSKKGGELPDRTYRRTDVRVDAKHLADYNRVCEFRLTDELPATYPHMLTFPMQVKLMTDADFPFPLVGSVHVANRITQTRALRVDEKFDLRVHVENLRPHPKGRQFDMISEALVDGEVVWHDVSTYLRRGSGGSGESGAGDERRELPSASAVWRAPEDIGRRYAEVSGDRNPIHLHALSAKLFGFPKAIAHGMWTKARCLAAFEGRLPEAYTVDVRFKLPVFLPAKVGFHAEQTSDGWRFDLFDARKPKPHIEGVITAL
ncbi:MaoC family dehydratase [Actinokineospora iranica]|uniref:MaoC like domain-containing protein n=1 Tax=Actinokineospora iranica TaxID=1271860 RepID=A0A1G6Q1C1_9PSEU|nr:MaoC/PaaZ C-terminal domain-containing protein [Actinokineospora iranica]SDC86108.1 MaoC like domain-containing protein [Actinokineospora iranica]